MCCDPHPSLKTQSQRNVFQRSHLHSSYFIPFPLGNSVLFIQNFGPQFTSFLPSFFLSFLLSLSLSFPPSLPSFLHRCLQITCYVPRTALGAGDAIDISTLWDLNIHLIIIQINANFQLCLVLQRPGSKRGKLDLVKEDFLRKWHLRCKDIFYSKYLVLFYCSLLLNFIKRMLATPHYPQPLIYSQTPLIYSCLYRFAYSEHFV